MSLAVRSHAAEQMDAADLDSATYGAILADLARANRLTMTHRPTIAFLKRAIGRRTRFRLLDVGFGQGDMLRSISAWAAHNGIAAELVGIDLNPRSAPERPRAAALARQTAAACQRPSAYP